MSIYLRLWIHPIHYIPFIQTPRNVHLVSPYNIQKELTISSPSFSILLYVMYTDTDGCN